MQLQRGVVVELELLEGAELAPVESVVPEVVPEGAVEPASVGVFADPAVEPAPPAALVLSLGVVAEVDPAVVPLMDPLVVPLMEPLVEPLMPGLVVAPVLAAALVLAPVEAMDEPDHQSRLARCFGEAFRYSSSMA